MPSSARSTLATSPAIGSCSGTLSTMPVSGCERCAVSWALSGAAASVSVTNGGAKVTTEGSVSIEDLKNMEAQGVEIRTCGTCLNYYGLTDKLAVGSVTNMYDIVETMTSAGKVIRP